MCAIQSGCAVQRSTWKDTVSGYSVFRCWLTPLEMQRLRWELTEQLEPEDSVLLIPLCGRCVQGMGVTHAATKRPDWPDAPQAHQIV